MGVRISGHDSYESEAIILVYAGPVAQVNSRSAKRLWSCSPVY